ncbi:MAG: TAT-variant-translocated molybdopterin oxidoreductase [Bryobacterales bacterium]|nr:TAT-variant-translocated molybdopterin oxidoreductase [Bryobacterales bacterium]
MSQLVQINPTSVSGKQYWRSLNELSGRPEFREWVEREFQDNASELIDSGSRRTLLKLMAASFGLAGMTACRRPVEQILPLSKGVEGYIPGKPMHYATAASLGGAATGLIVEVHDGRPTKIEGNPKHPYSLGATSAQVQASILNLYDPDRAKAPKHRAVNATWEEFSSFAKQHFTPAKLGDGAGLRIVSERSSSPSLASIKASLLKKFPAARWIEYESLGHDEPRKGAQIAFGQPLQAHYQFDKADVIFALDCDFLGLDSLTILPIKQFAAKRRVDGQDSSMNRLYAAESNYTLTGAQADHRVRVRASDAGMLALMLAKELNVPGGELKVVDSASDAARKVISAAAKDLAAHKGRSIVIAGPRQPAAVHALVALINQTLGNDGTTVVYTKPAVEPTDQLAAAKDLAADLNGGKVSTLVMLGGNPAYTMPADADFENGIKKAQVSIALTADENETWSASEWRLPETHPFETWSDALALDGTLSVQQPLIEPLYAAKSVLEVAAMIADAPVAKPYEIVKTTVTATWPAAEREKRWKLALRDGLVAGTASAPVKTAADVKKVFPQIADALKPAPAGFEVVFFPSSHTYDGRYANNGWLQEAPDPITKLVWDNAALISPKTAGALGVTDGGYITISGGGKQISAPAMILPGHADNSISLSLGFGRNACGRVGQGVGHRAESLRTAGGFYLMTGVQVAKSPERYSLVTTQEHHTLIEPITGKPRHDIAVDVTIEEFRKGPEAHEGAQHAAAEENMTMFPDFDYSKGYQWGMTIDLNSCIGCNACLVACQAENNIPVVGKDQVNRGREMHWIRLDRYFEGAEDDPQIVNQPMACQQCERAPCESVCPVAATVHSPEGLNEMAYNRCVGTRYCSNNCPYKVRRFNFLNFHKHIQETEKMVFNPDVTVRMRGVMEKCNYCVQRIQEKKIQAKAEGRRTLKDGEIITACQQVCPASAIVFGDINDPESRVAKMKKQSRDYSLLEELNIRPRTTYLSKVRNPNPELA